MELYQTAGDLPTPRFGHSITPISRTKVILFGGATGDTGKYAITGDTFLFDNTLRRWKKLETNGSPPSQRAAHGATAIDQLQMVVYGGAVGGGGLAPDDLYFLDLRTGDDTASWIIVPVVGTTPGRRYGHTLVYSKPHILTMGGNTGQEPVNDVWTLNVEKAPFQWHKLDTQQQEVPNVRVYHAAALCVCGSANGMMVIFGGRTANQSALNDTWGLRKHRDGRWDWVKAPYRNPSAIEAPRARYQHNSLFVGTLMFIVGGRTNQVGESVPVEVYDTETSEWYRFAAIQRFRHACWFFDRSLFIHGGFDQDSPNVPTDVAVRVDLEKFFNGNNNLIKIIQNVSQTDKEAIFPKQSQNPLNPKNKGKKNLQLPQTPNIRLSGTAVIATASDNCDQPVNNVRLIQISQLQEENKRLGIGFQDSNMQPRHSVHYEALYNLFINQLIVVKQFQQDTNILIKKDYFIDLCFEVSKIFEKESSLLRLRGPIKVFGNLNGQFGSLMKLFESFGSPSSNNFQEGDIEGNDYLFLGDYVDRGYYSIEIISLLFALKMKYPENIFLLRGHHEDRKINKILGLGEECAEKFNEDIHDPNSAFQALNNVFDLLPLAAVIDDKILCVHGGIGTSLSRIENIESIQRPIAINYEIPSYQQQILLDLLWSDPAYQESEIENQPNPDREIFTSGRIQRFGVNRIKRFLAENNLLLIIRSHECVPEGFEQMSHFMMTVFSASDYGGKNQNTAAILMIKKNSAIVPKVIQEPFRGKWLQLQVHGEENYDKFNLKKASQFNSSISDSPQQVLINNIWFDKEEINIRKRNFTPPRMKIKKN